MNFPFNPKKKVRGKKKRKNSGVTMYKPTTMPFWADIAVGDEGASNMQNQQESFNRHQSNDNVIDLDDNPTPSIQTKATAQKAIEIKKKPVLNMQAKTQEKIKLKQEQNEQANKQTTTKENTALNTQSANVSKADAEKESDADKIIGKEETQSVAQTPHKQPVPVAKKETKKPAKVPIIMPSQKEPVKEIVKKIPPQPSGQTIPTLSNQGNTKRTAPNVRSQQLYANVQNYHHDVKALPTMVPTPSLSGYQKVPQNANALRYPLPRGVPIAFLLQQQNVTAIEPQQPQETQYSTPWHNYQTPLTASVQPPMQVQPQFQAQASEPSAGLVEPIIQTDEGAVCLEPTPMEVETSPAWLEGDSNRRLSAFERLGPMAQSATPQLTINLNLDSDKPVREVVDTTPETPVPQREEIMRSQDATVRQFLPQWPWTNAVPPKRTVSARSSKTAMMMEQEQMEEFYENDDMFIQVIVKGYPNTWTKEDVFDTLIDNLKGKSFIPCFTEFTASECRFLVVRSRTALIALHRDGLRIRKGPVVLRLTLGLGSLTLHKLRFLPKAVLRQRLANAYDDERKLNLDAFTLQTDVSHFIYFPLNRTNHQMDIVQLQSAVEWRYLTDLILSNNRIATVEGFDLPRTTPKLKHLDLSHNYLESFSALLGCRDLPLKRLKLEGNPVCTDFTDPQRYVDAIKLLFPLIKEIDGITLPAPGEVPPTKRSFSLAGAEQIVEKFLEVYFPILESPPSERPAVVNLYAGDAVLSVSFRPSIQCSLVRQRFSGLFVRRAEGRAAVADTLGAWPALLHDRDLLTADVIYHTDSATLIRIGGVVKITSQTLAVDEPTLTFGRTVLLQTKNEIEYKIKKEMLCWDEPTEEYTRLAFRTTVIPKLGLNISLDSPPDERMKASLIKIFMKLTELDKLPSERCLEEKDWNLKDALKFFTELLKLNHVDFLYN